MKTFGSYEFNAEFADTLLSEFNKAYSDKGSTHNYHVIYSHILYGKEINNFLEVGLFLNELQHTDLNAWANVYPNASIYGADIKTEQLFNRDNIRTHYVDQSSTESLNALKAAFPVEFDVIIDDASHIYGSTVSAFESLFPVVKSGGVYIIEDCQSDHENNNGWQQTVSALQEYFTQNNHTFEVFQSRLPNKMMDPETRELTEQDAPSDDFIICIYKQ
jgi:hypothetical protein